MTAENPPDLGPKTPHVPLTLTAPFAPAASVTPAIPPHQLSVITPVVSFTDVRIAPYTELLRDRVGLSIHKGGPIWPDWETRRLVRHCRSRGPVDDRPADVPDEAVAEVITEKAAWCGPISPHFGHAVADFSTRILACARMKDAPLLLFGAPPHRPMSRLDETPSFFRQLLDWYGVPVDRVRILHRPTLVKSLVCVGQQERLRQTGPSEVYLQLLLENAVRNGLASVDKSGVLYVSRAGVANHLAGESQLENHLRQLGVTVIRPETLPLREQLQRYLEAETLIFSEGSALHALQLLGRQLGHVHVLNRRPRSRVASAAVLARAQSLTFHPVGELICGLDPDGVESSAHGVTWLHAEQLLEALELAGLPRGAWDQAAFEAAAQADLDAWQAAEWRSNRPRSAESDDHVAARLAELGLAQVARPSAQLSA